MSQSTTNLYNPGPGNYNINRALGNIAYSMRPKTGAGFENKKTPGPGAYHLRGSFQNIPGSKIGTS
jgi:hypothetical protein